jgi:hypothetical protein
MTDLLGYETPAQEFVDIRNQRESVARLKAELCQQLNGLLRRSPSASCIDTIQKVTHYKHSHKSAMKVLQCKTSSRQELESAINSMTGWHAKEAA